MPETTDDRIQFTYAGGGKPPSAKSAAHEAQWAPLVAEVHAYCDAKPGEWHSWDLPDAAGAKRAQAAVRRYLAQDYRTRLEGARLWVRRGGGE